MKSDTIDLPSKRVTPTEQNSHGKADQATWKIRRTCQLLPIDCLIDYFDWNESWRTLTTSKDRCVRVLFAEISRVKFNSTCWMVESMSINKTRNRSIVSGKLVAFHSYFVIELRQLQVELRVIA